MPVLTVTQINRYISFKLKDDKNLRGITVKGEISNYIEHFRSGHIYFTLKDKESSVKAVMFSSAASRLKFRPDDGMAVIVSGSISVYERDGAYQLIVSDIQPDGAGAASVALEQLKAKLSKAGLFDAAHKRPLPVMPEKIGAVTSMSGAAIRDIVNVLSRRYPLCELFTVNAVVQGDNAPDSVCRGILKAEEAGCQVIIVGRGGGSSEDLSAFNTEKVAYAIYNCSVPVISAVGHETDFTIADLAADMRAPTPSAAAELAAPSLNILEDKTDMLLKRAENAFFSLTDRALDRLINLNARLAANSPENRLKLTEERISMYNKRIILSYEKYLASSSARIDEKIARLEALSPLKVLSRGYSLVYKEEKLIGSSESLKKGDRITIRFGKGDADAEIL